MCWLLAVSEVTKWYSYDIFKFFFLFILAVLGLWCYGMGFSLVAVSGGYSLVAVCGLLIAVASLFAERRF